MEFNSKEEVTNTVKKLYCEFYERKKDNFVKRERPFSEHKFSQKIGVAQPILNSLRHGGRKELSVEISTKILKGIGKDEYIDPVSRFLTPETHRNIISQNSFTEDFQYKKKEGERINDIFHFLTSKKILGRILAVVSAGHTTLRDIKNITTEAEPLLQELVKVNLLEVSKNKEVKFTKEIKDLMKKGKLHFSFSRLVDYASMLGDQMNPVLVEKNKEAGYGTVLVCNVHKEDMSKAFAIVDKCRKEIAELADENPGGKLKFAWTLLGITLYDPDKYDPDDDEETLLQ